MPMKTIAILSVVVLTFLSSCQQSDGKPVAQQNSPMKVFLLIGQSNMNGRGHIATLKSKLIKNHPEKYPESLLSKREDVWIHGANGFGLSLQTESFRLEPGFGQWEYFGPELGFGHSMGDHLDEQILLIKVVSGGSQLATRWTSPSMSKRTGRPLGDIYKRMIRKTLHTVTNLKELYPEYNEENGFQLAGVFWVHGNADKGKYALEYEDNLVDLINDIRTELNAPKLPFVAMESLSSRVPGTSFQKAVARVNQQQGNQQAVALLGKIKINLSGDEYKPYNANNRDRAHWRWNSKAYLDAGTLGAELMKPLLLPPQNQSPNSATLKQWQARIKEFLGDPERKKKREAMMAKKYQEMKKKLNKN